MSWQLGVGITEFFLLTLVSLRSTAYGHDEARCDAILGPVVQCDQCIYPNMGASSYTILSEEQTGNSVVVAMSNKTSTMPALGQDIQNVEVTVQKFLDVVRITLRDANHTRWEVPSSYHPGTAGLKPYQAGLDYYSISYQRDPFEFTVSRRDATIFDTSGQRLILKDQYLELSAALTPGSHVYGLGEQTHSYGFELRRDGRLLTLWNEDTPAQNPDVNLYGSHPFYMEVLPNGRAHGVLLMNSNGMDVQLTETRIQFRIVGGIVDLYVMIGASVDDVMDQMTRIVGRPAFPPYWSLGFHNCKYGYPSLDVAEAVVANYSAASIPLEAMWLDIDYMHGFRDYTFDAVNFPADRVSAFVDSLAARNMSWVPIVDPAIMVDIGVGYRPYDLGFDMDVFIKDRVGVPYYGKVWPGPVHFPDFSGPKGQEYWQILNQEWYDSGARFHGLWIDMNEPSNFVQGTESVNQSKWDSPPYAIDAGTVRQGLAAKTAPMTAYYNNDPSDIHYNRHNLYGLEESMATHRVVANITRERPFVLTRSSFLGSGAWAAHWGGDNAATWNDLRWSLSTVKLSNFHGMPMAGVDICGFNMVTTEELCNRWIALGAFYPFARDHSDYHGGYQELYRWASVASTSRKMLTLRYQMLPYLYTAMQEASETGMPVVKPLFMVEPSDARAHAADDQFMLGWFLMVTPVLDQGARHVTGYFPATKWYSIWDHSVVDASSGGIYQRLDAPLGDIPAHVWGPSVLPMQDFAMTTTAARKTPLSFLAAMPADLAASGAFSCQDLNSTNATSPSVASGSLYMDDGVTQDGAFVRYKMTVEVRSPRGSSPPIGILTISGRTERGPLGQSCAGVFVPPVANVTVLGWAFPVAQAHVVSVGADGQSSSNALAVHQVEYNAKLSALYLTGLGISLSCPQSVRIAWGPGALSQSLGSCVATS